MTTEGTTMKVQDHAGNTASSINQWSIDTHIILAKEHCRSARDLAHRAGVRSYHISQSLKHIRAARVSILCEVSRLGSNHPQYATAVHKLKALDVKKQAKALRRVA
jgi:pyruvate kinase